jgi:hypothetical protein
LDKIIVTSLLIIAGVISAIGVFNALYPMIGQSSDTMKSMQARMDERFKTQIQIIHAAKTSSNEIDVWVKNIGATRVLGVASTDVFFGPQGNFARVPYNTGTGTYWQYSIEGGSSDWNPSATIKIVIKGYTFLGPGTRYFCKIVLPNGVDSEYYFSE